MKKIKVLRRLKIRCTAGEGKKYQCPETLELCYYADKTIEINGVNIGTASSKEVEKIVFFLLAPKKAPKNQRTGTGKE
jgi:uncharacterized protein YwlG (UPF0340 family)